MNHVNNNHHHHLFYSHHIIIMSGTITPAQQEAYLNKLRQQVQAQMMQEVMTKMTEKCFKVQ